MTKYSIPYAITLVLLFAFTGTAMAADISNPGTINGGTFTIADGDTLTIDGGVLQFYNGVLVIESGGSLVIKNNGYVVAYPTALIKNSGNITIEKGTLQCQGTLNNYGNINNEIYGSISNDAGRIYNYGTINNCGLIRNYRTINNYGTIYNSGTIENSGTINIFEGGNTFEVTTGNGLNYPPTSDPSGPYKGIPGVAIDFDGSKSSDSNGNILYYDWDFGDDNYESGISTTHTYEAAGTYTVTLTVTDNSGCSVSNTTTATITDPGQNASVPEFPTIVLPMVAVIGLAFIFRKRE